MNSKIIISSLLLLSIELFAQPSWYHNIPQSKQNTYIGYGSGTSEAQAKQNALVDISSQIKTTVKSETKSDKKVIDGKYSKDMAESSSQNTEATLSDYTLLKSEQEELWYVAVEYENKSGLDKFIEKIKAKLPLKDEIQNLYLANTSIAKELKNALGVDIDFKLYRKNGLWYLKYKDTLQVISKRDFEKFFVSTLHPQISLNTDTKNDILRDGETYSFKIDSKQDGYVTLLDVYEDGTVGILAKNLKVSKDKPLKYPNENSEELFVAGLIEEGVETFDLYVAIYSPTKLPFDRFAMSDSELLEEERYKNFDELIEFLGDKTYTTIKIITKSR